MTRHQNVINSEDLPWEQTPPHKDKFASVRKQLAAPAGGERIGCSLFRLEPGKAAFPAHVHYGNEEAVYILSGEGSMRLGDEQVPVRQGDYIAMPVAGPAHQLKNTSQQPLEYLCISTMIHPEVVIYPDSGKVGAMAGAAPGGPKESRVLWEFFRRDGAVDYYEGE